MHFQLIDQVTQQDDRSLTAIKNVSAAEEYLQDHFPGFAVLPGVMMLEAIAQAGRALAEHIADADSTAPDFLTDRLMIASVRGVKYANLVRPGQTLEVTIKLRNADSLAEDQALDLNGRGTVDGEVAVTGRLRLVPARALHAGV